MSKESGFLRWKLLLWKIVEMTTKDLEYYKDLVAKAVAEFERIASNSERSSTVGKMLSNTIACYREIVCERRSQLTWHTSLLSCFKEQPLPNLQQPPS